MTDHPSGHTQWEAPQGRGLPTIPQPQRTTPGGGATSTAPVLEPVAGWLGWAPTSWRSRGRR
jgi:hypothetical protein